MRDPALDSATTGAGLPDAIATGIRYAVAHHAKVIDLPLDPGQPDPAQVSALPIPTGTGATTPPQLAGINAAAGGSTAEAAAVDLRAAAQRGADRARRGQREPPPTRSNYPAAYPGVISVGGFGQNFALAPYSSRQPYVTLTAPGQDVIAADAAGSYEPVNSTTAASAIASGVAALIRSRFPGLSAAQVRHAMTSSTVFRSIPGRKHGAGLGTVNAERALAAAAAAAAPASQRAGSGSLPLTKPASPPAPTVQSDALKPRVLRAGLYAGGVLVILLLLIAAYAALRGRRRSGHRPVGPGRGLEPQPAARLLALRVRRPGPRDDGVLRRAIVRPGPGGGAVPPVPVGALPRRAGRLGPGARGRRAGGPTGRAKDIESAPGCRSGRAHAVTAGPRQYPVTRPGSPRPSPIANCPGPCPQARGGPPPGPRSRLVPRPPAWRLRSRPGR